MINLVEHRLHSIVIMRERFPHALGKTRIIDEIAQAFARETKVPCTFVTDVLSRFFRPAPFWQCGERPLPNAH